MTISFTPKIKTNVKGRSLSLTRKNSLAANEIEVTSPTVDASITVGDEASDVRAITITLKDANGSAIDYAEVVELFVFKGDMTAIATTGGSTGIAIGASGAILTTVTAKKRFTLMSTTAGVIALTWTDTGTESVNLGVRLPSGRIVLSGAFANA